MSVAEAGETWLKAVTAAPFVAILFWTVGKVINTVYQATRIEGSGEFARAQKSVHNNALLALDLLELVSSTEAWILFGIFVLAVYGFFRSRFSGF